MKPQNRGKNVRPTPSGEPEKAFKAARIEEVRAKVGKRVELAAKLGVSESRISEYVAAKRMPTPETWIKLGKLALEHGLPEPLFFWAQAGIEPQTVQLMADKVIQDRHRLTGETVPIPRFWYTDKGREEAGPPVPFPVECAPNPLATVCLVADEKSTALIESPKGLLIVDTSYQGSDAPHALWDRVVVLHYPPDEFLPGAYEKGLYVGRLLLSDTSRTFSDPTAPKVTAFLQFIRAHAARQTPEVQSIFVGTYADSEGTAALAHKDDEAWREFELRARSRFRFPKGVSVFGKVIGRLTGHLEK